MSLMNLIRGVCDMNRSTGRNDLAGLHSAAEMETILKRERTRADRTGLEFSLLTVTPVDRAAAQGTFSRVAAHLKRRLRCTDDMGWSEEGRCLAAVFSNTAGEGAWKIADEVCRAFPAGMPAPHCQVYTYPTDGALLRPATTGQGAPTTLVPPGGHVAAPMETLFAQALPLWKRCLDVFVSGTALVALLPLFAIVAAAIKYTSRGPVFFAQKRSGLAGRQFSMYKFRSMVVDAEALQKALRAQNEQDGPAFKLRNDPRITGIGHFIRKTSIDELPQLLNVLRGEMSLVGPRPLPCHESDACTAWQRRRLDVTPGLTCIWQVYGRSRVTFTEWMRMDLLYVRSRTLLHDLKLLVSTVPAVLFRRGAC